ncbi:hypothetical protein CPC08DRAFT_525404 [Agrocybe pediades]|nr:hypothetical protein CPC08DRAFT_525404 [Agrocybe pediades]
MRYLGLEDGGPTSISIKDTLVFICPISTPFEGETHTAATFDAQKLLMMPETQDLRLPPLPPDPLGLLRDKLRAWMPYHMDRERFEEYLKLKLSATDRSAEGIISDQKEEESNALPPYLDETLGKLTLSLFDAIERDDIQLVDLILKYKLVPLDMLIKQELYYNGRLCTICYFPLTRAVTIENANYAMVKLLLEHGANPKAYCFTDFWETRDAIYSAYNRNVLMIASSRGLLPIVKLLCKPPYSVDDSIVTGWGEMALRLAAAGGHRAVVDYLPARRGGGLRRCKRRFEVVFHHAYEIVGDYHMIRRYFIWPFPKHLIFLAPWNLGKWCWEHKHELVPWCKRQVVESPNRVVRGAKALWRGVKRTGKVLVDSPEGLWKFGTKTFPKWSTKTMPEALKDMGVRFGQTITWFLELITKRASSGIHSSAHTALSVVSYLLSILRLRSKTEAGDSRAAPSLRDLARAVFITLPKSIWKGVKSLDHASTVHAILVWAFGNVVATIACILLIGLKSVGLVIPLRILYILIWLPGKLVVGMLYELLIYIHPKVLL